MKDSIADRELVVTRRFDAPRALVWSAWTEPARFCQWMGPRGFTTTVQAMDVRRGGQALYLMVGPDGTEWMNRARFTEVVPPERLVYLLDAGVDDDPATFEVTVTLASSADGKQTQLTMRTLFPSAAELERVKAFGAVEGGQQTLDKLAAHLAAG
ncbi:MAG: SRPBCC family protein [Deltaproteobacteria bacterium]|nr:SRPBCC family protein [Deltaproteobacteria bacterium]